MACSALDFLCKSWGIDDSIFLCNLPRSTQVNDRETVIEGRGLNEESPKVSIIALESFWFSLQYDCKNMAWVQV